MKVKVSDYISYLQNTRFKLMLVHFSGDWLCLFFVAISGNTASQVLQYIQFQKYLVPLGGAYVNIHKHNAVGGAIQNGTSGTEIISMSATVVKSAYYTRLWASFFVKLREKIPACGLRFLGLF